jgi:hypothetical protein
MADITALSKQARGKRELAGRVRRIARGLSYNDDHRRMIQQAEELEAEARELERRAAEDKPSTGHAAPRLHTGRSDHQSASEAPMLPISNRARTTMDPIKTDNRTAYDEFLARFDRQIREALGMGPRPSEVDTCPRMKMAMRLSEHSASLSPLQTSSRRPFGREI